MAAGAFKLAHVGELSARQRARFLRETRAYLKEKDKKQLAQLRERLEHAKYRQREVMKRVVKRCQDNRQRVRDQVARFRAQERERINREVAEMKATARRHCDLRKAAVRDAGLNLRARRKAELEAERHLQRELAHTEAHAKRRHDKFKRTAREVAAESDDRVRANIDPELRRVFDRVRRSIRGDSKKSRTEAFLQWVEENPADVIEIQQEGADVEVKQLLAEQAKLEREARKRSKRTYKPSKAELAEYLEGVPF